MPVFSKWVFDPAYDYTRFLSLGAWAWEFLRRNGDYAADWHQAIQSLVPDRMPVGEPVILNPRNMSHFSKWGLIFRR